MSDSPQWLPPGHPPPEGWHRGNLPAGTKFIARLEYKGARTSPIYSGYCPNWWIGLFQEGQKAYNDAWVLLLQRDQADPGETVEIALRPKFAEYWGDLAVGHCIEMCEGPVVCGIATILEVL